MFNHELLSSSVLNISEVTQQEAIVVKVRMNCTNLLHQRRVVLSITTCSHLWQELPLVVHDHCETLVVVPCIRK
jgi:hypothetical protein